MPAIRQMQVIAAALILTTISGCGEESNDPRIQQLNTWSVAEWLHDIDAAKATYKAAQNGELGPMTEKLDKAIKLGPEAALERALAGGIYSCYKHPEVITDQFFGGLSTAGTDHACLEAAGFKRRSK